MTPCLAARNNHAVAILAPLCSCALRSASRPTTAGWQAVLRAGPKRAGPQSLLARCARVSMFKHRSSLMTLNWVKAQHNQQTEFEHPSGSTCGLPISAMEHEWTQTQNCSQAEPVCQTIHACSSLRLTCGTMQSFNGKWLAGVASGRFSRHSLLSGAGCERKR